jgi:aryl-alcohol dehydrogenase-like predicted oxidoreductase
VGNDKRAGLAVFVWSPLAMGLLSGRYDSANPDSFNTFRFNRGGIYSERITKRAADAGQAFFKIAQTYGLKPAHLALLWVKDQPHVTAPLCGPRTLSQLQDILPVMEMSLADEIRQSCDELIPPGSAIANFFNSAPWMKGKLL